MQWSVKLSSGAYERTYFPQNENESGQKLFYNRTLQMLLKYTPFNQFVLKLDIVGL